MGGRTNSCATARIALRTIWPCKPHHYIKVGISFEGMVVWRPIFVAVFTYVATNIKYLVWDSCSWLYFRLSTLPRLLADTCGVQWDGNVAVTYRRGLKRIHLCVTFAWSEELRAQLNTVGNSVEVQTRCFRNLSDDPYHVCLHDDCGNT
jgi:hypothetical protein